MILNQESEFKEYLDKCVEKLAWVTERNKYKIPYYIKEDGTYNDMDNAFNTQSEGDVSWWTNGFFSGILWQLFNYTKENKYRDWARIQEVKLDRCFDIFTGINHDVGFMWLHTSVSNYLMTQDPKSKIRAIHAANILAGRLNINGGYIRAWGVTDDFCDDLAIIDCLMNLSLLYWASEETKDPRFKQVADIHSEMTLKYFQKDDGSVHHIVKFNSESGEMLETERGQGFEVGSSWARGQGWGIYGFINSYLHNKEERYLEASKRVADYFIDNLGKTKLAPIDFKQPKDDNQEDNSAACIAACGMIELANVLQKNGDLNYEKYLNAAKEMLRAVCEQRLDLSDSNEALVRKCAVAYHFDKHVTTLIYADYFLLEGLLKLQNKELRMW